MATVLGSRSVELLHLTRRLEDRLQAHWIATAAVSGALRMLEDDPTPSSDGLADPWRDRPERLAQQPFAGGFFTIRHIEEDPLDGTPKVFYGLKDEESKINLNTATHDMLYRLLESFSDMNDADRQEVVDSIIDWRDEDTQKQPYGAEDFYYLGLDPPYECKDAPFENLEELLLIKGMTPALFAWMVPKVTVFGSGKVNLNTASRPVLKALGLSNSAIEGIVFFRSGEDHTEGTEDDRSFSSLSEAFGKLSQLIPKEDLNRLVRLDQEGMLTVVSEAFRFSVVAEYTQAIKPERVQAEVVMDRKGRILLWHEE
jgi:type II secretory pathway component PulK